MSGFKHKSSTGGQVPILREVEVYPSTYSAGDALEGTSGVLKRLSAQDDKPEYIILNDVSTATVAGDKLLVAEAMRGAGVWAVAFTPLYNDLSEQNTGNSSTTVAEIVASGRSSNDLVGGLIYCKELNETRVISASTATSGGGAASGNILVTANEAFSASLAGKTIRVVAFGYATTALKFVTSTPYNGISNAVADITGGYITVKKVDMKRKIAHVTFNP